MTRLQQEIYGMTDSICCIFSQKLVPGATEVELLEVRVQKTVAAQILSALKMEGLPVGQCDQ